MSEKRIIRNIVFDLGGVLVDFKPERCMEALGFSEAAKEAFRREIFGGIWIPCDRIPYDDAQIRALFREHLPGFEKEADRFWDGPADISRVMPFTETWLRDLKAKGLRLYVLSNYGRRSYELNSPGYGFLSLTDGKLISYEIRYVKPEPEIYRTLCERFAIWPEESVFLDDRPENVEAARQLGFSGIVFGNYEQASACLEGLLTEA